MTYRLTARVLPRLGSPITWKPSAGSRCARSPCCCWLSSCLRSSTGGSNPGGSGNASSWLARRLHDMAKHLPNLDRSLPGCHFLLQLGSWVRFWAPAWRGLVGPLPDPVGSPTLDLIGVTVYRLLPLFNPISRRALVACAVILLILPYRVLLAGGPTAMTEAMFSHPATRRRPILRRTCARTVLPARPSMLRSIRRRSITLPIVRRLPAPL